jgi:hypothetical protein
MSDPIPPGLPAGAVPIEMTFGLEQQLAESKRVFCTVPMSLYSAQQIASALLLLEAFQLEAGSPLQSAECRELHRRFVQELTFPPLVRKQLQTNRAVMKLPPL